MSREDRIRRYWEEFWSQGDTTAVTGLYAPSFRLNGEVTDRGEWLEGALAWRSHFEDLAARVDFVRGCNGSVVSRVVYTGTFARESYRGLSPHGRRIEIGGLDVFEFDGELVVEHWHEADHHAMFVQLGGELRPAE